MRTDLTRIADALAGLTDIELHALIVATNEAPQIAPGLLAWIEGACDWELNRRRGLNYTGQPPDAAIDPSEDAVSIEATYAMRASIASLKRMTSCKCGAAGRHASIHMERTLARNARYSEASCLMSCPLLARMTACL